MVDGDGVVGERHRCGLESHGVQFARQLRYPCPGHEEYRPHRHSYRPSVEWVTRVGGEQHGVYAQCSGRPEYRSDVGGVNHSVYHHHSSGIPAHLLHGGGHGAPHGAEHASCQGVSRERGEQFSAACVDGHVGVSIDDAGGIAIDMFLFAQQGHGFIAGSQCHVDHFGTFGDENAFCGFDAVAQLCLGQRTENLHPGMLE